MSEIAKTNSINPLNAAPLKEKKNVVTEEKLRDVANLYENHFIREMMRQMRSTVHESGFIKQNNAEKIFRDQLDDQYADKWGQAGGIGLSDLIYNQLVDKFGAQMGLRQAVQKPEGPIALNQSSQFSGVTSSVAASEGESITMKLVAPEGNKSELTSPWAGTLLDKKYLDMDQIQYRIKHDNGLESLILTRGTGLGKEQNLSLGDTIRAGQQLGWVSDASPLFWTIKPNVSE